MRRRVHQHGTVLTSLRRDPTQADPVLHELKAAIRRGWPTIKQDVPICIHEKGNAGNL